MDHRAETQAFLTSRRARLSPRGAGFPAHGVRRVSGLRRGEVAVLAGVSVEYYTRLERGNLHGVSDSVLDAVARALQLDDTERTHLYDLARAATVPAATAKARRRATETEIRPGVQHLLAAMTAAPAFVRNNRFDILAANQLGRALYAPMVTDAPVPLNTARFIFLHPAATVFFPAWERVARAAVGALQLALGRDPYDGELSDLIGELSAGNDTFRGWWEEHDVYVHRYGSKRLRHPVAGDLELAHEALDLPGDTGLTMVAYSAESGSASDEALRFLAAWAATHDVAMPEAVVRA
jgi:transcriptional regulator with XRE-family HTH domain